MKMNTRIWATGRWYVSLALLGGMLIGPTTVRAANVCNGAFTIQYPVGPNFVIPGDASADMVTVQLNLGAGPISGVVNPRLTINRLRFDLACPAPGVLGCSSPQTGV